MHAASSVSTASQHLAVELAQRRDVVVGVAPPPQRPWACWRSSHTGRSIEFGESLPQDPWWRAALCAGAAFIVAGSSPSCSSFSRGSGRTRRGLWLHRTQGALAAASGERLDVRLVQAGLAASRHRAVELVKAGHVLVNGSPARKPGCRVAETSSVKLLQEDFHWVGRGALKLLSALEAFPSVAPSGLICADLGSSVGGFTEVLLDKGAEKVFAIDVGTDQLAEHLRRHSRVVVMEGVNARYLNGLPIPIDLAVGDLSFISLSKVLPAVKTILRPGTLEQVGGEAVVLVKPQFEVGKAAVGGGGLVRNAEARDSAIKAVAQDARDCGFEVLGGADCAVKGSRAGNVEHFLHLRLPQAARTTE